MSETTTDEHLDEVGKESISDKAVDRYEAENSSAIAIRSLDDISRLSKIFIQSGMFKGDRGVSQAQQVYQAGVKIIAGVEFGIQPFAAIRGINIINGNAEMSANLMAAKVKKHPKYDYRVTYWENDGCVIEFYEIPRPGVPRAEWDKLGVSSFKKADAEAAGLMSNQTWRKFPRNMYFARAISNGVRIYTPDVFYGAPVYVEGEISGDFEAKADESPTPPADDIEATQPEPVEGEIVETTEVAVGDEPTEGVATDPLQEKLDEIAELAEELGHGPDWFVHVSTLIRTEADAEQVYSKLRTTQIDKMMNGE
ncbi:hypothetical protein BJF87_21290 [Gordonia sp. CNJ-863]|uniref:hypothetical protein n=1 Tax=Gordonia sp. CNJ-863 TaxID=1904963 RepID=UPI00095CF5B0|nr:hypothetical protein [Gordonia sp. CNJ-863]OLT47752.1 hypothetical protein BJF87_21290 [Gordonia sp. CNJ-863]